MNQAGRVVMLTQLWVAVLHAGTRGSADYVVTSEVFDAGGGASASADYAVVSSVGGIDGTSSGTLVAASALQGYMAQLTTVAGLDLTSSGVSVNEGGTVQLTASATLDDGTLVSPDLDAVSWRVVSGPAGVSTAGLVTASPVYQDTQTVVSGSYQGVATTLSLTVVNTNSDNYWSYANDGLPDAWQVQYFGIGNPDAAPARDPDHDGSSNAFEYAAGLVPTSATSRFVLTVQPVAGQPAQRQVIFSPRYDGITYIVEASTDLVKWDSLTNITVSDAGNQRTVTDTAATEPIKFYRIGIGSGATGYSYADDGIPDAWQIQYFGLGNPAAAPGLDPDHDGYSNAFEYAAGLIPTSATSRFFLTVQPVAGQPAQRQIIFSPRYEGSSYTVETSTDLVKWDALTNFTISDTGTQRTVTDTAASGPIRYYRVGVTKP